MLKVGITGGIGSGKTIICQVFRCLGIPVFEADQEARQVAEEPAIREKIEEIFGIDIYKDETLDREQVAKVVFGDSNKLEELNAILHPEVQSRFENWLTTRSSDHYVLKEAAILFESGSHKELDFVVNVNAQLEVRVQRVIARDGVSREKLEKRIAKQWTDDQRSEIASFNIDNSGTTMLIPQILKIHEALMTK